MMAKDSQMQDLLDILTDAVLNNQDDFDTILQRYDVPYNNVDTLLGVVQRLHGTLAQQEPSKTFMKHLKKELLKSQKHGQAHCFMLPNRVQTAAGAAAIVGVVLIAAKRYFTESSSKGAGVPAQ